MGAIFIIFGVGAGLYCIYAYIMMITKKEINTALFLPKEIQLRKCKDVDGYIKETSGSLLVLGIVLILYGVCEAINIYYMAMNWILIVGIVVVLVAIAWFAYKAKKANQKYYGL